ncbi:MAG: hypothetical protein M1818_005769 [Claussenomyces sp. TS43310]|nr:MAG: hypothetical protein M1818_005769 [Claussenomyces sp. TS43310]
MSTEASSSSSQPSMTNPSSTSNSSSNARQIAEARAAIQASMHNIGSRLDADLQSRATTLHSNAAALSKQESNLGTATRSLGKETDKLKRVVDDAQRKIKELGNVQNWAEVLEREFLVLEETMRLVEEGSDSGSGSEGDWEPCRICGEERDEERLVFCDGYRAGEAGMRCDAPFHIHCVGLTQMPVGDWFCPDCKKSQAGLRRTITGIQTPVNAVDQDAEMGGMDEGLSSPGLVEDGLLAQSTAMLQHENGTWS